VLAVSNKALLSPNPDVPDGLWYFERDDGTDEAVSCISIQEAVHNFYPLISFLQDWDAGIVIVTYQDYLHSLPATLIEFRRHYQIIKQQLKNGDK